MAVLQVLERDKTYGYEIAALLLESGFGDIKGGTLYPLLGRLERVGLVRTQWRSGTFGPGRKYYALTEAGREELAALKELWAHFSATTATHLGLERVSNGETQT
ncbi:PadR family transcriptional regulator [Corynebacterium mayonis]|uniref:PadR family transcriptional regulator n=1 Tax=Corynebacterium mayonis TaxID=3062461 RepID=UPI00314009A5